MTSAINWTFADESSVSIRNAIFISPLATEIEGKRMKYEKSSPRLITLAAPLIGETEKRYVNDCLNSSWISSIGSYLACFEEGFAHFCQVKHAIRSFRL